MNNFFKIGKLLKRRFSHKPKIENIPDLKDYIRNTSNEKSNCSINLVTEMNKPYMNTEASTINKSFYIETYGCQMNENDSEIVSTILDKSNYTRVDSIDKADVILTNTCAIRESAEEKIWNKIKDIKGIKNKNPEKIFGILGCMAERMKEKLLEKSNNSVDLIVGPDAYRDLPRMIEVISNKDDKFAMNVQLSLEETYGDIMPVRKNGSTNAFISIMRGCNNMCSFCIVPFTRGRERSRNYESIMDEVKMLRDSGVKEITLLGQNVNSYLDETYSITTDKRSIHKNSPGFRELFKLRDKSGLRFSELFEKLADIAPEVRFRFTSPHPKDFPEELIQIIKEKHNICKQ